MVARSANIFVKRVLTIPPADVQWFHPCGPCAVAAVAQWLERPGDPRTVAGSIPVGWCLS